mmetsp:Transcript_111532/g.279315  ORF Transcript_111532/g.279315 Transcript_111532/m.279315 type:complete len:238 (-) Transcript_111532:788-1501(-)
MRGVLGESIILSAMARSNAVLSTMPRNLQTRVSFPSAAKLATKPVLSPFVLADNTLMVTASLSTSLQPGCWAIIKSTTSLGFLTALRMSTRTALCWHSSNKCNAVTASMSSVPLKAGMSVRSTKWKVSSFSLSSKMSMPNMPRPSASVSVFATCSSLPAILLSSGTSSSGKPSPHLLLAAKASESKAKYLPSSGLSVSSPPISSATFLSSVEVISVLMYGRQGLCATKMFMSITKTW